MEIWSYFKVETKSVYLWTKHYSISEVRNHKSQLLLSFHRRLTAIVCVPFKSFSFLTFTSGLTDRVINPLEYTHLSILLSSKPPSIYFFKSFFQSVELAEYCLQKLSKTCLLDKVVIKSDFQACKQPAGPIILFAPIIVQKLLFLSTSLHTKQQING